MTTDKSCMRALHGLYERRFLRFATAFTLASVLGVAAPVLAPVPTYGHGSAFLTAARADQQDVPSPHVRNLIFVLQLKEDGTFEGHLLLGDFKGEIGQSELQDLDTYLEAVKVDNQKVESDIHSYQPYFVGKDALIPKEAQGRHVTFTANSIDQVNRDLEQLLGTKNNSISFSESTGENQELLSTANVHIDCAGICDASMSSPPLGLVAAPASWGKSGDEALYSVNEAAKYDSGTSSVVSYTMSRRVVPEKFSSTFYISSESSLSASFQYTFSPLDAMLFSRSINEIFGASNTKTGEHNMERNEQGIGRTFTTRISNIKVQDFQRLLNNYMPGSEVSLEKGENDQLTLRAKLVADAKVTDRFSGDSEYIVVAPDGMAVVNPPANTVVDQSDGAIHVRAKGINTATMEIHMQKAPRNYRPIMIAGIVVASLLIVVLISIPIVVTRRVKKLEEE